MSIKENKYCVILRGVNLEDLLTDLLEHVGYRLKRLNLEKPIKSRLQKEKNSAGISELKMILEIIQKHQNENY